MLDTKTIITLVGLGAVISAISMFKKNDIEEGFVNYPLQTIPQVVAQSDKQFFAVPGQYQALLAPRFSNVDYGADIRYNLPSNANMAVPLNPLSYANMAARQNAPVIKEGYGCGSCGTGQQQLGGPTNCNKGGISEGFDGGYKPLVNSGYAAGNFNAQLQNLDNRGLKSLNQNSPTTVKQSALQNDLLPIGTMRSPAYQDLTLHDVDPNSNDNNGDITQPIVYDRYITASANNRIRSQGDFIRGDLPIMPVENGWFNPSVNPSLDLQQGALNVMGGYDAGQAQAMSRLMMAASQGATTAVGGINLQDINMSNSVNSKLSAGLNDLQINRF